MVVLRGDADDITAGVMVDQVHQIVALSPSRFKEAPAELPLPDKLGRVRVGRVRLRQLHDDRARRGWCARRGKLDGRDRVSLSARLDGAWRNRWTDLSIQA